MDTDLKEQRIYISVIAPIYNEVENLDDLYRQLTEALRSLGRPYEIVLVDDGSQDGSVDKLRQLAQKDHQVKVIEFRRNFGQTAAMAAGIDYSSGEVIVLIDADLQNDPRDIPKLIEHLEKGYDVVSGWRKNRQDALLRRRFPSRVANGLISLVTGVKLKDYGCTLKAYRREVLEGVKVYGEMHRFLPAIVSWQGARIAEVDVNHRPRTRGKSKYGLNRILKVLLDLVTVKFFGSYSTKPIRFFGVGALLSFLISMGSLVYLIVVKLTEGISMIQSPLLLLSAITFVVGIQLILMGLIAEICVRIYHESQGKKTYAIRSTSNLAEKRKCAESAE